MERCTLNDAIFDSQYAKYFLYRLRYFFIISLFALLTAYIEFSLLRDLFPIKIIAPVLLMRVFVGLISSGWWGSLEILREYVRGKYHFYQLDKIKLAISCWLILSLIFASILLIVPLAYIFRYRAELNDSQKLIYDVYLVGFIIHTYLEFGISSYHSGVYALKRIYRPLSWIIICGSSTVILLHYLWQIVGVVGLPLAFILGEVLTGMVRVYYTRQAAIDLNLSKSIVIPTGQQFYDFITAIPVGNTLLAFFAGIALNAQNIIILPIYHQLVTHPSLLIYFYLLRQLYQSYSQWGVLFYYDFKKMRTGAYPPFYKGFLKRFFPLSLGVSLVFYIASLIVTYFFHPHLTPLIFVYLGVFFLLVTFVSFLQIHAFSLNSYKDLVIAMVISLGAYFVGNIYFFLCALPFLCWFLIKPRFPLKNAVDSIKRQSIYTLMLNLENELEGYTLTKLKIYKMYIKSPSLNGFLSSLALHLNSKGWICPLKYDEYIIIEPKQGIKITSSLLTELSAGLIQSYTMKNYVTREACLSEIYHEISKNIDRNQFYIDSQENTEIKKVKFTPKSEDYLFQLYFPLDKKINLLHAKFSEKLFSKPDKNIIYTSINEFSLYPLSRDNRLPIQCCFLFKPTAKLFFIRKINDRAKLFDQWNQYIHYLNFKQFSTTNYKWQP